MLEGAIPIGQFMGPLGGLLCIAWAMGAISGYVFHSKTVLKMHEKLADVKQTHCDALIAELRADITELEHIIDGLRSRLGG